MSERTASCLCGAIKIEIQGSPFLQNLCHCESCQKYTGATFGTMAAYKNEQLKFTESEADVLKTYNDTTPESGGTLKRSFCGNCGSPVRVQSSKNPGASVIPVGIIDGGKDDFKPQIEFFCKRKAGWVGAIEGAKTVDAMP
ncbi:hypothetical protein NPX13_g7871 [Xylaria arbuscula]|uniref:CENP-V/GFA domain-containing protein n=1 Tax=Xylaria arbuscula TaxID=114810 RepID=A0A9W8N9V2_9PEZI|nr:hypothetical protein NPX13_g7871 [Xylaria arbuscula]